jgi:hypothetical protein
MENGPQKTNIPVLPPFLTKFEGPKPLLKRCFEQAQISFGKIRR